MGEKKRRQGIDVSRSATARVLAHFVDRSNDTPMPEQPCLACGHLLDVATATNPGHYPKEGAISLCWRCGHLQAFGPDLKFRPLTDAEMTEVAGHPAIVAANNIRGPLIDAWKRDDRQAAIDLILDHILSDLIREKKHDRK
jgi:hypothetical protein